MDKEKKLKQFQEKINEFTQRLEGYDRFCKSYSALENIVNWLLAINIGTFLWFIDKFNNFKISNTLPNKMLFLTAIFLLGLASLCIGFIRTTLYLRQIGIAKALEDIWGLPNRIELNMDNKTAEELGEMIDQTFIRSIELWQKSHNLICHIGSLFEIWLALYFGGLTILCVYITVFIIVYL